ncbi:MAG: Radical SAM protein [Oscillospiraceae bacterium]|jgi:hypothetical protein
MEFDTVIKRAAIAATVNLSLQGIHDDPRRSMKNAVDLFSYIAKDIFDSNIMSKIRREAENPKSCFYRMVTSMVQNVDHSILKTVGTNMCFNRLTILTDSDRFSPKKVLKLSLPLAQDDVCRAVNRAKALGVYFFVVCGRHPLRYKDIIFDICRKNRDCVFYITAEERDINDSLAKNIIDTGNIIIAVRISTSREPEEIASQCRRSFEILKSRKCLFGYIAEIGSLPAKSCCSDGFINYMAKLGCLFGWYYISESGRKVASCQLAVKKLMNSALTSRSKPLLLLNPQTDRRILRRFVTGGRCYLSFAEDGIRCRNLVSKVHD